MLRYIIISLMFMMSLSMMAVSLPSSLKYLDGYFNKDPNAAITVVTGKPLKQYALDEYRGLTITYSSENASMIEEAVKSDIKVAEDKEIAYRKGKLYYAFLTLPGPNSDTKRYIFYLDQTLAKGDKVILIYMSGKASAEQIKKMIKK